MAEVYRARREGQIFFSRRMGRRKFSREVAVKLILPHLSMDESFRELFSREAHLASLLDHPNIVDIQDYGHLDRVDFIVMEYVKGVDLRRILKGLSSGESLPLSESICILYRVARGLAFAHGQTDPVDAPAGIIHCDLSPHNILISSEGEIKIADFGIARAVQQDLTRTGTLRGKAPYMSPEQVEGRPLDHRSDLFSLGSMAYQMFTGRHPFTRPSDAGTLAAVRDALLQPLTPAPGIPEDLVDLVHSLLERDPDRRPTDAAAVAATLEPFLDAQSERELADRIRRELSSMTDDPEPLPTAATLPRPRSSRLPASAAILAMIAVSVWVLTRPVVPETAVPMGKNLAVPTATVAPADRETFAGEGAGREASAFLNIRTEPPGAEIRIDGEFVGRSPVRTGQPAGDKGVTIEASLYGYRSETRAIGLETGPAEVAIDMVLLPTSTVRIGAVPWAEVVYRGESLGYTPLTLTGIPVGNRKFLLRNEAMGLSREVTLLVRSGGANMIYEDLQGPLDGTN